MEHMNWSEYFFALIKIIREKSKDKSTKVGSIIVGPDNEIRSTGYNSFPRGINDDVLERHERPNKYLWFEHAERNAIYNAARVGTPLKGCTMYLFHLPCPDCARAIIQSGITKIIVSKENKLKWNSPKYHVSEMYEVSTVMLQEAGVEITEI